LFVASIIGHARIFRRIEQEIGLKRAADWLSPRTRTIAPPRKLGSFCKINVSH
jgi:hypothetical protein